MKCSSLSLLISFSLKYILSDIRIVTLACFLVPFYWSPFLAIFLTLMQCLFVKVSFRQHKEDFCDPFNQLISFDWSIEIIEMRVLIAAFVLFIFGVVFSVILYVVIIITSCFFPQSLWYAHYSLPLKHIAYYVFFRVDLLDIKNLGCLYHGKFFFLLPLWQIVLLGILV